MDRVLVVRRRAKFADRIYRRARREVEQVFDDLDREEERYYSTEARRDFAKLKRLKKKVDAR